MYKGILRPGTYWIGLIFKKRRYYWVENNGDEKNQAYNGYFQVNVDLFFPVANQLIVVYQ